MKPIQSRADIAVVFRVKQTYVTATVIRTLIIAAAKAAQVKTPFAVNVQLVGSARSQMLNRKWRKKDKPTNVLSFAAREGIEPRVAQSVEDLGDIIVCPAVAKREAPTFHISVQDHVKRLVVHGFLHLLGQTHEKDADAKAMEKLEWSIVRKK